MSGPDVESLKQRLIDQREELLGVAESSKEAAQTVELDQTRVGRVSRMDALQAQAMAKESNPSRLDVVISEEIGQAGADRLGRIRRR